MGRGFPLIELTFPRFPFHVFLKILILHDFQNPIRLISRNVRHTSFFCSFEISGFQDFKVLGFLELF